MPVNKITSATTDNELILSWLKSKHSIYTQKLYLRNVNQFKTFINKGLNQVLVEDLQDFLTMLKMKGYKLATIASKFNSIKSCFSYALSVGYITVNPCAVVKTPSFHDSISSKLLTSDEVKLLISHTKHQKDALLIKMMFALGLRVGEIIKLQWQDFSFNEGKINLTVIGKGNKKRVLLVTKKLYDELLIIKSESNPYIFHAYNRQTPIRANTVHYMLKKAASKAGLTDKLSAHWLRHSHATESLKNGCDISLLQQSLGHSKITTTQKYLCLRKNEGSTTFIDI